MCFSAESSFVSAVLLGGITLATGREVKTKAQRVFLIPPFVFMLMQLVEAGEWLAYKTPYEPTLLQFGAYFFFIISYIYWLLISPCICFALAKTPFQKKAVSFFFVLSLVIVLANLFLMFYAPSAPCGNIVGRSIQYTYSLYDPYPFILAIKGYVLLFLIAAPILIVPLPLKWVNVVVFSTAFFVASYFYVETFVSVWCFFAAVTSVSLLASLILLNQSTNQTDSQ